MSVAVEPWAADLAHEIMRDFLRSADDAIPLVALRLQTVRHEGRALGLSQAAELLNIEIKSAEQVPA